VLSAGGATTAPGAYLAAAMKPTETTAADPADREDDR